MGLEGRGPGSRRSEKTLREECSCRHKDGAKVTGGLAGHGQNPLSINLGKTARERQL